MGTPGIAALVPRRVLEPRGRIDCFTGTFLIADISGFTRLSERLASRGDAGTEQMISTVSTVLGALLECVKAEDGDVLDIGGDALEILFAGPDHEARARRCSEAIFAAMKRVGRVRTDVGSVVLNVSQGLATGPIWLLDVGTGQRDLIPWGPTIATALQAQKDATSGQRLESISKKKVPESSSGSVEAAPGDYVPDVLIERIDDVRRDSEHRMVCTAFVVWDSWGSTPEEAAELGDRILEITHRACVRESVTITSVEGEGAAGRLMLTSGAPLAVEEDADALLRVLFAIVGAEGVPAPQVGVTRGPSFAGLVGDAWRSTWSAMGDPVNVAARLAAVAKPGEILAEDGLLAAVRGALEVEPTTTQRVRSRKGQVNAWRVLSPPRPAAARRLEVSFVGREDELAEAAKWLQGSSGLLDVSGPPGIGTTRFAETLLAEVPHLKLAGRSDHSHLPYSAVRPLMRSLLDLDEEAGSDDLAAVAGDEGIEALMAALGGIRRSTSAREISENPESDRLRAARITQTLATLIADRIEGEGPLWIDRPELLDDMSRRVVVALAALTRERQIQLVVTRREAEQRLAQGGTSIELPPLSMSEATALARDLLEARSLPRTPAPQLAHASAGIPRSLIDLAYAWTPGGKELPADATALAALRLDRLPPSISRMARFASVLGEAMELRVLQNLLADTSDEALSAAAQALALPALWDISHEVLRLQDGTVTFVDPLVMKAAYGSLSYRRRRALHARAAASLAALSDAPPALLAHHHAEGGNPRAAWRYSLAAGDGARGVAAFTDAATSYERAVKVGTAAGIDPDLIAATAERWGEAAALAGKYEEAISAFRLALSGAAPGARARLLRLQAHVEINRGRPDVALRLLQQSLKAADGLRGPAAERARAAARVRRSGARYRQGKFLEAEREARQALAHAKACEDPEWEARAHMLLDSVLTDSGREAESVPHRNRALELYRHIEDHEGVAQVLNNYGVAAYWDGDLPAARDWYTQSLAEFTRAGDVVGEAMIKNNLGEVASDLGELDVAEDLFAESLMLSARAGHLQFEAGAASNLALLLARKGKPQEAIPLLRAAIDRFTQSRSDAYAAMTEVHLAGALADAGELDEARDLVKQLVTQKDTRHGLAPMAETIDVLVSRLGLAG